MESINYTDLVEVICYCMPNGSVYWFKRDDPGAASFFHDWKQENSEFINTDCVAGMSTVHMPRFYYDQLRLTLKNGDDYVYNNG